MLNQANSNQTKRIIFQRSISNEDNKNKLDKSLNGVKAATIKQINGAITGSSPIIKNGRIYLAKKENQFLNDEMLIEQQEAWQKKYKLERMTDSKIITKRNELDTLIAIVAILLLFLLALHLAPNQHYSPSN